GISMILITDDGCGIEKSQIEKAFMRHATSKIETSDDLAYVTSLGFRGEALSSICAVCQVEMITKTKEDFTGIRVNCNGGVLQEPSEVGAPDGTTIIVRNIFYNTPVRQKFLKSKTTEGTYISDLMQHLALSKPHISFKFIQNIYAIKFLLILLRTDSQSPNRTISPRFSPTRNSNPATTQHAMCQQITPSNLIPSSRRCTFSRVYGPKYSNFFLSAQLISK
ncbi:MAG: hypothetical protein IIW91_01610, partial [Alistipes sp.]|nr:hypothetical protein [Alistipes sp.]